MVKEKKKEIHPAFQLQTWPNEYVQWLKGALLADQLQNIKTNRWGFNEPNIPAQIDRPGLDWSLIMQLPCGAAWPYTMTETLAGITSHTKEEIDYQLLHAHRMGIIWIDAFAGVVVRLVPKGASHEYSDYEETKFKRSLISHAMKNPRQKWVDRGTPWIKPEPVKRQPIDRGLLLPGEKRRLAILDQGGRDYARKGRNIPLREAGIALLASFPDSDNRESLLTTLRRLPDVEARRIAKLIEQGYLRVEGDYIYRV